MEQRCTKIVHKALAVVRPQFRLHFEGGIHGLPHWSRVWFHGRALAASLDVDPAVLAWFAYLHDSQRHNDHHDPQHGQRAADFALRLRRAGVICELAEQAFEHLCEAMRLHSDGHTIGEPAILACWDADRLDLARVGSLPAGTSCGDKSSGPADLRCDGHVFNPGASDQAPGQSSEIQ